jgi:hypothetical protein
MPNLKDGRLELLTDKSSALVLVDYQPTRYVGVASGDKTIIRDAAYCAAKAADIEAFLRSEASTVFHPVGTPRRR